jgi:hypothetical protein
MIYIPYMIKHNNNQKVSYMQSDNIHTNKFISRQNNESYNRISNNRENKRDYTEDIRKGDLNRTDSHRFENKDNFRENYQDRYKETNRDLIKYIYTTVDIAQFKFDIIRYEQQLSKFVSGTYFISPNYSGKNCFLVFTKLKTKYYSFMIDRRQLSYTLDKVRIDDVFVNHCNVDVDLAIYDGTILDGIYIRRGLQHEFIVTDVYSFKGADYTNNKLNHKLFELEMYFDNINSQIRHIKDRINAKINLELKINKLHKLTDIKNFLDSKLKEDEKTYQIRGLCFYPELSGTKLIYLDNENNENIEQLEKTRFTDRPNDRKTEYATSRKEIKDNSDDVGDNNSDDSNAKEKILQRSKNIIKRVFVSTTNNPVCAVLEMQSTKTADNYKLFALEQVKEGTRIRLKKCQMDIAYIPNMKKSQWCKDITTASPKGSVFVKCIWRDAKSKWEPMELKTDVKLPSLIDDIRKDIVEMEKSDSDSNEE